jgi:hypothetical protein
VGERIARQLRQLQMRLETLFHRAVLVGGDFLQRGALGSVLLDQLR